ncbi:hypothetical protein [Blastococcus sp. VKM Ac-2987]|uniref:hypothetical protein n=1 Tax=Blastococcus sp. VKM Ac-2987 TaxID=3004141 RepID=UPI0022ABC4ED|nr:hypothetical protein [Blastococcus sp. VKM Ac-2987]MCZ2859175.1 hypothetical protein [Blastococcus sp. VKM Ac-2987]
MRRLTALLVALVLAGCGGEPVGDEAAPTSAGPVPAAVPPVPGIAAEAVRLRTDEAVGGRIQVRVTATADEPFTVTAVALDVPGFAPLPPVAVAAAFAPGRVIDLPTPYGAARCPGAAAPAAARLTVLRPDGAVDEARVPLGGRALERVHDEECAAAAVARAVELGVTDLRAGDEELSGRLTLTRRQGDERVGLDRVTGNVQFDVAAELPLELAAGAGAADGAVRFTVATCDGHVLAEVKQPYVVPLGMRIGDEPVVVDLPVDDGLRTALADLVARVCRGGS